MQRQVARRIKKKLELKESSISSDSSSGEPNVYRNPFAFDSGDSDAEKSGGNDGDDQEAAAESEVESVLLSESPREVVQRNRNKTRARVKKSKERESEGSPPKGEASKVFCLRRQYFDSKAEVTHKRTTTLNGCLSLQFNVWLCPHNELMEKIKLARSGVRWLEFDPENELYFKMRTSSQSNAKDKFYDFFPTERYVSLWSSLELCVGSGDINALMSFAEKNPYHPGAMLHIADFHIQRDEFETAHGYIEKAIGAFQYGLSANLNFDRSNHRHRLGALDLRNMASVLSVLGNDMTVDWHGSGSLQSRSEREGEIRKALTTAENGNFLFIKALHMYAFSLLQRGYNRTALEFFRFVNMLTLGSDHSHSLLFVAECAVRATEPDVFLSYNNEYLEETADIDYHQYRGVPGVSEGALKQEARPGAEEWPLDVWSTKLESILPHFSFGYAPLLIRMNRMKTRDICGSEVQKTIEGLSMGEVKDYLRMRVEARATDYFASENPLRSVCLALIVSVYLYPNFPLLIEREYNQKSPGGAGKLMEYPLFAANMEIPDSVKKLRFSLLQCYLKQTSEFWLDLHGSVIYPCSVKAGELYDEGMQDASYTRLVLEPWRRNQLFLAQYRGVRVSEFDSRQPVIADAILNSSVDSVGTNSGIALREELRYGESLDNTSGNALYRWWREFARETGEVNIRQGVLTNFLRSLMPWAVIDFS